MSKQTITKFIRTHAKGTDKNGVVRFFKRVFTLPPLPLKDKPCGRCGKPMQVADGQIMHFHKECRKMGKRMMK